MKDRSHLIKTGNLCYIALDDKHPGEKSLCAIYYPGVNSTITELLIINTAATKHLKVKTKVRMPYAQFVNDLNNGLIDMVNSEEHFTLPIVESAKERTQ